ncbi:MAG: hypothetical protein R3C45_12265 [Phycisphaerales bacterium]
MTTCSCVLDRIYRRACIGTVRLRTTDYRTHIATKDDAWVVAAEAPN